jgi:hypothetical protein
VVNEFRCPFIISGEEESTVLNILISRWHGEKFCILGHSVYIMLDLGSWLCFETVGLVDCGTASDNALSILDNLKSTISFPCL